MLVANRTRGTPWPLAARRRGGKNGSRCSAILIEMLTLRLLIAPRPPTLRPMCGQGHLYALYRARHEQSGEGVEAPAPRPCTRPEWARRLCRVGVTWRRRDVH